MIEPYDLLDYGIQDVNEIIYNPSYNVLFAEETKPGLDSYEKGIITRTGAISVDTGIFTGRSPKDKCVVPMIKQGTPYGGNRKWEKSLITNQFRKEFGSTAKILL